MKRSARRPSSAPAPIDPPDAPVASQDLPDETGRIIEHPDGWYWMTPDERQQFGPFRSYAHASADRDRNLAEGLGEPESLRDIEIETGIADRIDLESGKPADDDIHEDDEAH